MILQNIAEGNGEVLATLAIKINRSHFKPVVAIYSNFVKSAESANRFYKQKMVYFMRTNLADFAKQRKTALTISGNNLPLLNQSLFVVEGLAQKTEHTALCIAINKHQNAIRALVPSSSSQHYYWHYTVEEIIHYAHQHAVNYLANPVNQH